MKSIHRQQVSFWESDWVEYIRGRQFRGKRHIMRMYGKHLAINCRGNIRERGGDLFCFQLLVNSLIDSRVFMRLFVRRKWRQKSLYWRARSLVLHSITPPTTPCISSISPGSNRLPVSRHFRSSERPTSDVLIGSGARTIAGTPVDRISSVLCPTSFIKSRSPLPFSPSLLLGLCFIYFAIFWLLFQLLKQNSHTLSFIRTSVTFFLLRAGIFLQSSSVFKKLFPRRETRTCKTYKKTMAISWLCLSSMG